MFLCREIIAITHVDLLWAWQCSDVHKSHPLSSQPSWGSCYYFPHFSDGETEEQRVKNLSTKEVRLQPWQSSPIGHFLNHFATLPPKTYRILFIWGLLSNLNILSFEIFCSFGCVIFESCRNSKVAFSSWWRKLFSRTFFRNWLRDLGHILPHWLIASCVDWGWGYHCF